MSEEQAAKSARHVRNAARVLDKVIPGWHRRVDLEKLNMNECTMCMLGQTFGEDAETAIAKELYPEEWAEVKEQTFLTDGYRIGINFLSKRNVYTKSLSAACSGTIDACVWAEAVAERRARDEQQTECSQSS